MFLLKQIDAWVKIALCFTQVFVCLHNIRNRNRSGEVREVSLGEKKLSYKEDTISIEKGIISKKKKERNISCIKVKIRSEFTSPIPNMYHLLDTVYTAYDLLESPDKAQWECVQQSHDWKRRNHQTTLSSAIHLLFYFFFIEKICNFSSSNTTTDVLSTSKNYHASFW